MDKNIQPKVIRRGPKNQLGESKRYTLRLPVALIDQVNDICDSSGDVPAKFMRRAIVREVEAQKI